MTSNLPPNDDKNYRALRLAQMLEMNFPVDKELLGPMIREKSLGMIAGQRGGGKSWLVGIMAYATTGEKTIAPWGKGAGVPVAILDGEMRAASLKERLAAIHSSNGDPDSSKRAAANLCIISRDCMQREIGYIDTEEGQRNIDELIPKGIKLIIVDNLSAWTSGVNRPGNRGGSNI